MVWLVDLLIAGKRKGMQLLYITLYPPISSTDILLALMPTLGPSSFHDLTDLNVLPKTCLIV